MNQVFVVECNLSQNGGAFQDYKILIQNFQGAGSKKFLNKDKEHQRMFKSSILTLLETHVSDKRANIACRKISLDISHSQKAQHFQGGI